ncbi:MAG: GIY-YIG nuclease family protein [Chitinophagaceae bacterium]|nr:GIY-YIG nuclease family protein [Chitinophagaceae bacterium]
MKGFMYILRCADDTYYVGSTKYLGERLLQHQNGQGSIYTQHRLPVELIYFEEFARIDHAFYREKQVQGWSRKKKQALMKGDIKILHDEAVCRNWSHYSFGSAQSPINGSFDYAQPPDHV